MKNIFTFLLLVFIGGQFLWGQPANLVWNTQSRNASESMPCGGGDIGMNVWVENDDVLFYLSRSGSFDENNCLLKQGRFRVRLTPNPFAGTASFRQTLHLNDGYVKGEGQQCSYKWAIPDGLMTRRDSVCVEEDNFTFFHRNPERTIFDVVVDQQGMNEVKEQLYNPLKNLIFGGRLSGDNLVYNGTRRGHRWWNDFWKRSFIEGEGEAGDAIRNYTLFRYMLGCNAYSQWPTKFNGGLFTFDPMYVDQKMEFTPDFRKWGGGTMTAQNQRLVYWPMLKSGDFDLMKSQFDFYLRLLPTAEARTRTYWGHAGACFTEQMENFGLPNPAEYGFKRPESYDRGLEYNAWLEYEWDTVLEFCQMILETARYNEADISRYIPLIESSLNFFDEHYRQLALQRGRKDLDGNGKLVIYPGSACETYKMAYNPSSTIAALRSVLQTYGRKPDMLARIPEIPLRIVDGKEMIAPAQAWERVNNIETPQLYAVFPWRMYGVGKEGLEIARNTYLYDPDAQKFRSHIGWKQDNIWAACLGMTEEAAQLTLEKMANGPHRFPAFWGPGYDWTPDHNWGGSGMIGMQEMLLQEADGKILLFPAWPKDWDVHFKLHATGQTTVEAVLKGGTVVSLTVLPKEREKDVVNCLLNK